MAARPVRKIQGGQLRRVLRVLLATLLCLPGFLLASCLPEHTVVIYTSVDQVYSEPVFLRFTQQTGIQVRPVYDIEVAKSVGLANRLIAEKNNPQADVFWNGEILQTLALKANGVLTAVGGVAANGLPPSFVDPDRTWFGIGGRARVLLYNKALISPAELPQGLAELAGHTRIRECGLAFPIFGTAATQAAALYASWGPDQARAYYARLAQAGTQVLEGNSVVKDYVSQRRLAFGLTDSDDALAEMAVNPDLAIQWLDQHADGQGTLVIPNTVAAIRGGPHPVEAAVFMTYLLDPATEQAMVDAGWIQVPVHSTTRPATALVPADIRLMTVDFNQVYACYEASRQDMADIFVR